MRLGQYVKGEYTSVSACTLVHALVYCNFLREVRLGGWGSEGPKGLTLGQYVRVRVCDRPIFQLRSGTEGLVLNTGEIRGF